MAGWNGSGGFTFPYSWEADAAAGINILASRMDTQFDTVSVDGFGNTLTRDGQGQPTANLPMAGFRHTGASAAVSANDYVIRSQITGGTLAGSFTTVTASSSIDAGGNLNVNGVSQLNQGATINTGGITITAGGLVVVAGGAGVAGGLTVTTGGLIVSAGTIALSPTTGNVDLSPVAGTLTINPGGNGTMNKVAIGGTTPAAGTFTTLIGNPGTTGNQATVYSQFTATTGNPTTLAFPGGGTMVGGSGTSSTSGLGTISFGVTFSAAPIVLCTLTGSATDAYQIAVQSTGTVSFVALATLSGSGQTGVGFNWMAIGKV